MDKYNVTGMTCAACSARVEKVVSALSDVEQVQVNLLTNSMTVEGKAAPSDVIAAVVNAGYGASLVNADSKAIVTGKDNVIEVSETKQIAKRLIVSVILLIPLMYLSMGHMMWGWPLPHGFLDNPMSIVLTQLLLTIAIMIANQKFFISGFKAVINKAPNMDTLVALGSGASFLFSVYATFALSDAISRGDMTVAHSHLHEMYYESAAMILTLITVGKMLESYSKGRTTDALKGLMNLAPKTATIIEDNLEGKREEKIIPAAQVKVGDLFVVKPGEAIPVDGEIVEGNSAIDESALTGESIPVDKNVGDSVNTGTMNTMGYIICKATRVGEDTTLFQIIQMVSDAAATKAPIAKIADRVSGVFVPTVLTIAAVTFIGWIVSGQSIGYALARAVSVLVISCPCALGLATPVAIMVGNGVAARNGILFKNSVALENAGKAKVIVLDKTGTLTEGKPVVVDVVCADGIEINEFLANAYAIEERSEHPLARAVVKYIDDNEVLSERIALTDFSVNPGNGLKGMTKSGTCIYGGNERYISRYATITDELGDKAVVYAQKGYTPVHFANDRRFLGMMVIADVLKSDAVSAIEELHKMEKHVVMLTGDNERTAKAIGELAGVDEVIANVLPQDKEAHISRLKEYGQVVMVGDGINDAPALTRADVGIAIGAGTDIAMDAAQIVLINSKISDVVATLELSKKVLLNIKENLFWAFFYNMIGIPLAAGVFIHSFGWTLNPMFGALAMSLSSFCVVTNALRLNMVKLYGRSKGEEVNQNNINDTKENLDSNNIKEIKENKTMTQTLKIEGMMCPHCQAHMTQALNAMEGVDATVDHKSGTAVVNTTKEYSFDEYKAVVEQAGYALISME